MKRSNLALVVLGVVSLAGFNLCADEPAPPDSQAAERKAEVKETRSAGGPAGNLETPAPAVSGEEKTEPKEDKPSAKDEKAEAPSVPVKKSPEFAGCAAPLKDIIVFHEKEAASLKKMAERWNARIQSSLERQSALRVEIESVSKDIAAKQEADERKFKKEIIILKRQLDRLAKQEKAMKKEMRQNCADLSGEVKDIAKEAQLRMKEQFTQVQEKMKAESE
jgi:small-conductance mechanosensitive channel